MKNLLSKFGAGIKTWWNTLVIQPTSLIIGFFMGSSSSSTANKNFNVTYLILGGAILFFIYKKRSKIKRLFK